jgi:pseudouridine-5'-phosphate glycosidase
MSRSLPPSFIIEPAVARALDNGEPVVALESTVITHGLPYPENFTLARDMEEAIRLERAEPATIAVLDGRVRVGLKTGHLERLASDAAAAAERRKTGGPPAPAGQETRRDPQKLSGHDLGVAVALRLSGGTTVAGTLAVAARAGIQVFATGGIGGVHRGSAQDVSADLSQLARSPLVVVCSGAKSILDLPATLEVLETLGIPVIGYRTDDFPAFFSPTSGLKVPSRAETPEQVAQIARAHWALGLTSAALVVNPPPAEAAVPFDEMEGFIQKALAAAAQEGIAGKLVTPYLLEKVREYSGGQSLSANLALLRENARLAAQVAGRLARRGGEQLA